MKTQTAVFLEKQQRRVAGITVGLVLLLIVLAVLSLMMGTTFYSLSEVHKALFSQTGAVFAIQSLRLPRTLAGILTGMALGMAGNTFQKLLGNPLASPDIIGITSGASLGAVICILVLRRDGVVSLFAAVCGGFLCSLCIYLLAGRKQSASLRLILVGIGMQAFLQALISYLLLKAAPYDVPSAMRWLSGSLNGMTMTQVMILALPVLFSVVGLLLLRRTAAILSMGNALAVSLGVSLIRARTGMLLFALLLSCFAVAVSGPIASVAFLAGPIASYLCKGSGSHMLQAGIIGALLVVFSDILAQNLFPARYPIGVVSGMLGAPYLLYQLCKVNRKG